MRLLRAFSPAGLDKQPRSRALLTLDTPRTDKGSRAMKHLLAPAAVVAQLDFALGPADRCTQRQVRADFDIGPAADGGTLASIQLPRARPTP